MRGDRGVAMCRRRRPRSCEARSEARDESSGPRCPAMESVPMDFVRGSRLVPDAAPLRCPTGNHGAQAGYARSTLEIGEPPLTETCSAPSERSLYRQIWLVAVSEPRQA